VTPDSLRTEALENDPRNPCIGCGPRNPRGLRLQFRKEGDEIASGLLAEESLEGWPGRLHSGVLYLAMLDVANWTVYGLRNRVGLPIRTSALTLHRWVCPPATGCGWSVSKLPPPATRTSRFASRRKTARDGSRIWIATTHSRAGPNS
jgi:hypothetical protein